MWKLGIFIFLCVWLLVICTWKVLRHMCLSAWKNSAATVRIFIQPYIWAFFFRMSVENIRVSLKCDKNNGCLTRRPGAFVIISRWILLRTRNIRRENLYSNQNTHFMFSNFFLFLEKPVVYEIMFKNIVEWGRPHMTIWRMRIACWIPKATNTHTHTHTHNT